MRQMKILKLLVLGMALTIGSFLLSTESYAEDAQGAAGYTVESIIPDNQLDKMYTFFYLKTEPSQPQIVQVRVKSTQEEPVTVKVAVHDAVSSSVGEIDYANSDPNLDKSLKDPITSFVKIKDDVKEVTVAKFEEKLVTLEINPPKESYAGVKLGSIRFLREAEENDTKQTGLVPEFARVIAIMLTEDGETFDHGAELHLKKAGLTLANGRKVVAATIQNDQPKVLQEMTIKGRVTRKGEKEVVAEQEQINFSVAPNSNFDFQLPLGLEPFTSGTYVFTGEATGDDRTWHWEEEFTYFDRKTEKTRIKSMISRGFSRQNNPFVPGFIALGWWIYLSPQAANESVAPTVVGLLLFS